MEKPKSKNKIRIISILPTQLPGSWICMFFPARNIMTIGLYVSAMYPTHEITIGLRSLTVWKIGNEIQR